jgi:hypothetical protein
MTIELSTDDLIQLQEAASRYGACVLKTETTTGEEAWIAVQNHHRPGRKRAQPRTSQPADPEQTQAALNQAAMQAQAQGHPPAK